MFEIIFIVFVSLYFIQSILIIVGITKIFKTNSDTPSVTVIVAARNEEKNILACLQSLNSIEYPEEKLEIILVDDKSDDKTGEIIDEFIKDKQNFKKIITAKEIGRLKGKTNALANAIEIAEGDIIFTTDADCTVSPTWVKNTVKYYNDNIGAVPGFTTQAAGNSYEGMQALDFIYLLSVASSTINLNMPISCIGNNMSFKKKAYFEVGGYENLPFSVTEDFNLLYAIYKLKKYKIIFPLDVLNLVISTPCENIKQLYHQKKRWGVGGIDVPFRGYLIMAVGFITNLCMLLSPVFYTANVLSLIIFKIFIDYLILYFVHSKLNLKKNMKYFAVFELYYIIYVIALPFMVLFNRKVKWKGRNY